MDRQAYLTHLLNASTTKETHVFSKATRFKNGQKLNTEAIYALPPTSTKRSTSFGYGNKIVLANKSSSPPPGSYHLPSDFERGHLMSTATFHEGRDKVTFGSFLLEALKRKRDMPSPDRYSPKQPYSTIGGKMGIRITTDPSLRTKDVPGPGAYQLKSIQLENRGHYPLSTIKNSTSPRYFADRPPKVTKKKEFAPTFYEIQQKHLGRHSTSTQRNLPTYSFPRAARPSLADRSKLSLPGAKYRSFSQFGN